ncbi:MAG: YkgJ family cysteine cluster protein [Nanoarchaeota archaeon]
MKLLAIIDIILAILFIYFIFIRGYILAKRKFKCLRCGKCCGFIVNLPKEDIEKIKEAGYKDFIEGKNQLKKVNGYCIFMTLDKGICSCKLENSVKPQICKNFPHKRGLFGRKADYRCSSFCKFN